MELTKENVIVIAACFTAFGAFLGAIIVAVANLTTTWLNQRAEERKQYRALLMNTAVEYWKFETEKLNSTKSLEEYILTLDSFYEVFIHEKPDAQKIKKKMENFSFIVKQRWYQEAIAKKDGAT